MSAFADSQQNCMRSRILSANTIEVSNENRWRGGAPFERMARATMLGLAESPQDRGHNSSPENVAAIRSQYLVAWTYFVRLYVVREGEAKMTISEFHERLARMTPEQLQELIRRIDRLLAQQP